MARQSEVAHPNFQHIVLGSCRRQLNKMARDFADSAE